MSDTRRYQRAKVIFFEACEMPRGQRDDFVGRACAGDADLQAQVRSLLADDEDPLTMMGAGGVRTHLENLADSSEVGNDEAPATRLDQRSLMTPARIGRYRVLSRLGAGGMGVVYLAEQDNPRRQVALKVIASGQASRQALRRFEHEAQILGRLHHPGIAQVYEAGVHDSGDGAQPYFAMELVRGQPLLQYCAQSQADRRVRLELFIAICDAVQHAHQQGVIHRDLKPANILVEETGTTAGDGPDPASHGAQPKILDFGVARMIDSGVQSTTMHTAADQLIGTVAYMSPEQMSGATEQIDTRSDVFALGVILFEMLSGRLPHDVSGKSIPELIRTLSEHEPAALSSIDRSYRGDLDTIAGKAMEREPARRYESAGALAADVRRFLDDQPIRARPPNTIYQMRKFARRNKALVGGAAAVFVALVGGIITTSWQARQAIAARDQQIGLRKEADDNAARATASAEKAKAAVGILQRLLSSADPHVSKGPGYTVRQLLDDFAGQAADALSTQPDVQATVLETMGGAYLSLGDLNAAEPRLRQALDIRRGLSVRDDPALAGSLFLWGQYQHAAGDFKAAEATMREAMGVFERCGGHERERLGAMGATGDMLRHMGQFEQAILLLEETTGRQQQLGLYTDLASTLGQLASCYQDAGRHADAERVLRRALAMNSRDGDVEPSPAAATTMSNLGCVLMQRALYDESESMLRRSLDLGRRQLGEEHPEVAKRWNNLGLIEDEHGRTAESQQCFRRAIEIMRKHPEYDQSVLADMLQNIGVSAINDHQPEQAIAWLQEAIEVGALPGNSKPGDQAQRRGLLGEALVSIGRLDEAQPLIEESLAEMRAELGETSHRTIIAKSRMGDFFLGTGRLDEAQPLLEEVFAELMKRGVPGQRDTVSAAVSLGTLRHMQQRHDDVLECIDQVLPAALETLGPAHPAAHRALDLKIGALAALDRWNEADDLVRVKISGLITIFGEDSFEVADWRALLGINLHEEDRWDESEPVLRAALATLKALGGHDAMQARVTWRLGAAIATHDRYDEAEKLLLEGFQAMQNPTLDVSPNERLQCSDWLINLYRRWGKLDEQEKWTAIHATLPDSQ